MLPMQANLAHAVAVTPLSDTSIKMGERALILASIVAISESMLTAATAAHWEQLSEQESRRQQLTWKFFDEPLTALETERHARDLNRVFEMSQEITKLANAHREQLMQNLKILQRGRKAAQAYQEQSSDTVADI